MKFVFGEVGNVTAENPGSDVVIRLNGMGVITFQEGGQQLRVSKTELANMGIELVIE